MEHINITNGIPSEIYVNIGRGKYEGEEMELAQELAEHFNGIIASLEAERDKAVELLRMSLHSGVGVQDYQLREHIESFLASIGGEVKNEG